MDKCVEEIGKVIEVHSIETTSIFIIEGLDLPSSTLKTFEKEIKSALESDLELQPGLVFTSGYHYHSDYTFTSNFGPSCFLEVEKKSISIIPKKIYAINPEQGHKVNRCLGKVLGIRLDGNFLQNIVDTVYGKTEKVSFKNQPFNFSADLQNLIHVFREESMNLQKGYQFVLQSISIQLAISILRQFKSNIFKPILGTNTMNCELKNIKRAIEFLNELYYNDFSLEEVARIANLSPFHFIRVFKTQTGKTPYQYLLDLKIENAKEMLKNKKLTVMEISLRCGFSNSSHFASIFKKRVGLAPSIYRKSLIGV